MSSIDPQPVHHPADLADEAIATVRRWLQESASVAPDVSAQRLAGVLKDPRGLQFTLGFVDTVVRPEDVHVAGANLARLGRIIPRFLPWYLRAAIAVGGILGPVLPWIVVPVARRVLRSMVSHLVIDARPAELDKTLATLRRQRVRLNLNLLGEAVLGDEESDRRLRGTRELLERDDVDYVSIKVSSVVAHMSMWGFEQTVQRVVERLTPLYEYAAVSPTPKFINLDMEEYHDLDLTIAVFTALLDQPRLAKLEAGIVLQAYLPDALGALKKLTAWAIERRARGGAGIKVRVVKGANLAMERVDAALHGWPLATLPSKQETDTNYKRVLDWAFTPEHTDAVRIGVAGHNLFDVAFAWLLARQRHVDTRVEFEMLLGMATGQADAVKRAVGGLLLYTPVVQPHDFDTAIGYLVRRLEENADPENFMSGVFELASSEAIFEREAGRFRASLAGLDDPLPTPNRTQDRSHPSVAPSTVGAFRNEPDTDSALAGNRAWALRVLERSADSTLGVDTIAAAAVTDAAALETIVAGAVAAGTGWGATPAHDRARILHDAGDVLAAFRGRLVEVMASETGKTIGEADVEVSEAVDFAHYYAERALDLDHVTGARFVPSTLIVVTPPWNFPVAIPAGSVLSALASGAAVIIKPAPQARRCAAVMIEALWEAGVPREVLQLVDIEEGELGRALIADPRVDRVILTGAWETAALFRSWRPELPLLAETSGKNAIIVTPSADLDLAVADVVRSAFGHAGQKCSAASLVILVGSVASSERFRRQLVGSARAVRVGYPQDPTVEMGPIVEPAHGKLLSALTELAPGEEWLVKPRQLDETQRLWSPGVKAGVAPGSAFHLTEYFGPVLGIMTARTLDEAIALQNASDYGLTAGLHSLDPDEVAHWIDTVDAGNLYVNRGITGAIVRRQPFGGWKRSAVGTGAKAGGPNYLLTLGSWVAVAEETADDLLLDGISAPVATVITRAQAGMEFEEFERVRLAALHDQEAWAAEFGVARDVSALGVERNVFRYRPAPITLRLAENGGMGDLVRLIAAATLTRSPLWISSATPLPTALVELFRTLTSPTSVRSVVIETDARFAARAQSGELDTTRVRLVGGDAVALAAAAGGHPDLAIWGAPVTTAGRIELLPFLHEQAVSVTAHRFGNPDPGMAELVI
ncbi:bifunctional proline dehydrogenase/L-glutamate gamma-semialdehyde dehydrogenase [Galbitalea soli]|uniref:L-glutamate gamma-semialdehyde dehydrogenase n=1 Tax=Galbitalea soli TaxID=1268042 RepID=A0A7C9PQ11_9MICO|nr:bifunctional proline dehydrogenase/L-glutamate gamma-semialdehyde dehydrogenase [Galbitalea soli]NEM92471.1 bifunctional proline dehydrogenase/L-glutamate gamma-semialdehyde dehydrogenase [Galbitalea soli]NYJ29506.1 RHH-type proline utilization regulon transcriptional repressor/proline dehydrogenase/delta 1-pyrroline-5-carboxylate dehydrogenase [Galbitalea soli]